MRWRGRSFLCRLGGFSFFFLKACLTGSPGFQNGPRWGVLDDAACIGNPSLSFGYFLYFCIHLKLAYRWWREPIPSLGIVWQDAGSDQEFDTNNDGWYDWRLRSPCHAKELRVELKFEMKDGLKTSYRYRFLSVTIQPNGLVKKVPFYKSFGYSNN